MSRYSTDTLGLITAKPKLTCTRSLCRASCDRVHNFVRLRRQKPSGSRAASRTDKNASISAAFPMTDAIRPNAKHLLAVPSGAYTLPRRPLYGSDDTKPRRRVPSPSFIPPASPAVPAPRGPASVRPTPCRSPPPPRPALPPRPLRAANRPAPAPPPAASGDLPPPRRAHRSAPDSRRPDRAARRRSASTAARVGPSFNGPSTASAAGSSARHSRPRAPWPTAGSIHEGSSNSVMCAARPRRSSPACARMIASRFCSSSLRSRVSTLPRIVVSFRSGRRCKACARRRRLLVATTAPCGRSSKRPYRRDTNTSPVGPRTGTAPSVSPSTCVVGRSFRL